MARRMQANEELRAAGNDYHGVEHDEIEPCTMANPLCYPVPADPGVSVVVPRQGVVLVVDGVVQDVVPDDIVRYQLGATGPVVVDYLFRVREKPTFFEEGKTYRLRRNSEATFQVDRVKLGDDRVAFGLITNQYNHKFWSVRHNFNDWEEVK